MGAAKDSRTTEILFSSGALLKVFKTAVITETVAVITAKPEGVKSIKR